MALEVRQGHRTSGKSSEGQSATGSTGDASRVDPMVPWHVPNSENFSKKTLNNETGAYTSDPSKEGKGPY